MIVRLKYCYIVTRWDEVEPEGEILEQIVVEDLKGAILEPQK